MKLSGGADNSEERSTLLSRPVGFRLSDAPLDGPAGATGDEGDPHSRAMLRWQHSVETVVHAHRVSDAFVAAQNLPGAAPGVDPKRRQYRELAAKWSHPVEVTVVDYSASELHVRPPFFGADQLAAFLKQPRPASARVRWIHMDGLNWDAVQALAWSFDLHPLAIEDCVHVPQRIKCDFYDSCLYLSLIYLYLEGHTSDMHSSRTGSRRMGYSFDGGAVPRDLPRTFSSARSRDAVSISGAAALGPTHYPLFLAHSHGHTAAAPSAPSMRRSMPGAWRRGSLAGAAAVAAESGADGPGAGVVGGGASKISVNVAAQQVSLFLLRDQPNTLVTIFQSDGSRVTRPILEQLSEARTLVRESEDASFLAHLVLDTLVDNIFPVVSAFSEQLQEYESAVLSGQLPRAASTRDLHAMQRDLRRIARTISPLQVVVQNVVDRDGNLPVLSLQSHASTSSIASARPSTAGADAAAVAAEAAQPQTAYLSRLTRTYLGDVADHVATISEDLHSLSAECSDLIALIFNLTTHRQSLSAQTLAVVSTIFLPITFLAGVYGMNFDVLPELHWPAGYAYFWCMCGVIILVFMAAMVRAGMVSFSQ